MENIRILSKFIFNNLHKLILNYIHALDISIEYEGDSLPEYMRPYKLKSFAELDQELDEYHKIYD